MNVHYRYSDSQTQQLGSAFGGLDRRKKATSGMFRDMKNMSGDEYKSLVTRRLRGKIDFGGKDVYAMTTADVNIDGRIVENAFILDSDDRLRAYYTENGELKERYLMNTVNFTTCENEIVASGAYLYFFPEKKYINLMDTTDKGSLEAKRELNCGVVTDGSTSFWYEVKLTECDAAGNETADAGYIKLIWNKYEYKNNEKGGFLVSPDIGRNFSAGDVVKLSGTDEHNGYFRIAYIPDSGAYLVLDGTGSGVQTSGAVTVAREVPDMDYVTASGNRLWGCKYGVNEKGEAVNEIYASALGDAKNWYKFQGISTDSYTASIGAPGVFTGAVEYMGCPMFFKEDAVIRVYGDYPANFSVNCINARGVEKGSHRSLANVASGLYYKSHSGFVCYNAGNPVNIDAPLGSTVYKNVSAGTVGGKYYVSCEIDGGEAELLVFDTKTSLWHKEDDLFVKCFSRSGNELYMLTKSNEILSVAGTGLSLEEDLEWSFETGEFGDTDHRRKSLLSAEARMDVSPGKRILIEIEYNGSGKWQTVAVHRGENGRMSVRIKPRRCDTFRLRFSGEGRFALHSLSVNSTECGNFRGGR